MLHIIPDTQHKYNQHNILYHDTSCTTFRINTLNSTTSSMLFKNVTLNTKLSIALKYDTAYTTLRINTLNLTTPSTTFQNKALNIMKLSIALKCDTPNTTLSIITLNIKALRIITLNIKELSIITLNIKALSIITLTQRHSAWNTVLPSATIFRIMPSVVILDAFIQTVVASSNSS
jgi:hypothetical protein